MGAIGDDALADLLTAPLAGATASRPAPGPQARTAGPRRPYCPFARNGERPALHMPGATSVLELGTLTSTSSRRPTCCTSAAGTCCGPFGGEPLRGVLPGSPASARVLTTMDLLAPGGPETWDRLAPVLPYVQLLPAERGPAGQPDRHGGSRRGGPPGPRPRRRSGPGRARGADGAALVTADGRVDVPAFPVEVIDTTGCGDGCCAGFIIGPAARVADRGGVLAGLAAPAQVAAGLGSDAGIVDCPATVELLRAHAPGALRAGSSPTPPLMPRRHQGRWRGRRSGRPGRSSARPWPRMLRGELLGRVVGVEAVVDQEQPGAPALGGQGPGHRGVERAAAPADAQHALGLERPGPRSARRRRSRRRARIGAEREPWPTAGRKSLGISHRASRTGSVSARQTRAGGWARNSSTRTVRGSVIGGHRSRRRAASRRPVELLAARTARTARATADSSLQRLAAPGGSSAAGRSAARRPARRP